MYVEHLKEPFDLWTCFPDYHRLVDDTRCGGALPVQAIYKSQKRMQTKTQTQGSVSPLMGKKSP